jgi:hypothetical protein
MKRVFLSYICVGLVMALITSSASAAVTVLYNDQTIVVKDVLADPIDLWVSPEDLTRINGFVLKPEGACLDDICIPIKQDEDSKLFVRRLGQSWVNVTELARKLQQPYVSDVDSSSWSFGAVPLIRRSFLESAIAPDFALKDRTGKMVHLSDFRGKKVLIMTWASW